MTEKTRNASTAQLILDAALALWSEKGYADTTMRELARRLGMGVSSLYFYFSSKEEIVQFLYKQVNERVRARFFKSDCGEANLGMNLVRYFDIKLEELSPVRSCIAAILHEAIDPRSSVNPVSGSSSPVLQEQLVFFQDLVGRAGIPVERQPALAKLLWVGHMFLLLYWLHDSSSGYTNTKQLIRKVAEGTAYLPLLGAMPGSEELLELLTKAIGPKVEVQVEPAAAVEPELPMRQVDVVVLGGGPIGVLYASFLKQQRPKTSILVIDRASEPGHKIGESTLSGFCKALRSVGIRHEVMQRLFYPKHGLHFLHIDESLRDFTTAPEYAIETFDETFQVERRVLDSLVIANARRLGVQVVQGAHVAFKNCKLGPNGNVVNYEVGSHRFRVGCSLLVDASGPTGVVSKSLGMRTDEDVAFQTGSVWAYFSAVKPLASYRGWPNHAQAPRDQYTGHFCFRQGWMWYIPLVSWQGAPTANLQPVLDRMIQSARGLPERSELEMTYSAPSRPIVSVGLSLRTDRDSRIQEDPRGAFEHYTRKYPAIQQLLQGASLLEDYYGPNTTFMSRLNYRGHARQVAGDGWILVGDAAFFVDPLISPGLTGGVAGAYQAALASVTALDSGDFHRQVFSDYEAFIGQLQPALERDNELVYMSFNDPAALALIQRFQEIDARRHFNEHRRADYGIADTNVWGVLDSTYAEFQQQAWEICREAEETVGREVPIEEQTPRDYTQMTERLRKLLAPYVDSHTNLTPYIRENAGRGVR